MRPRAWIVAFGLSLTICISCGEPEQEEAAPPAARQATKLAQVTAPPSAKKARPADSVTVPNARQTFSEVMGLIADKYVDAELSEDQLWSGALQGVLDRLIQLEQRKINTLLDPGRLKELKLGLKGSFSGVGVVIKVVEDVVIVRRVLADGPADRAGIKPGDRILAVDGQRLQGLDLGAIVGMIRGKTGTTVKLFVQRDIKEWIQPVVRGRLTLPAAAGRMLEGKVAYLRVANFNEKTVRQLDEQIARLTGQGARGVLLDLRACPGGLLDKSLEVADRFLPPGARIISIRRREGVEEVRTAKGRHPADSLPVVALIDGSTASGAEIVAAALADNGRATLVGEPTMGKGTVETILSLKNGWALKLSVARFYTPKGVSLQGRGVRPDFAIPAGTAQPAGYVATAQADELAGDPQVQAALRVLALGR